MLIYNITIKVSNSIAGEWLKWQREEHIPEIMCTGLFDQYKFFRLLEQDDTEGPTFVFQFHTSDRKNYDRYINEYAPGLRKKALKKWGEGFIAFRTIMQVV